MELTGLTAYADYTFAAYSDSGCAAALTNEVSFNAGGVIVSNLRADPSDGGNFPQVSPAESKCVGPVEGTTVSLEELLPGTDCVFRAFRDENCREDEWMATTVFTTAAASPAPTPITTSANGNGGCAFASSRLCAFALKIEG